MTNKTNESKKAEKSNETFFDDIDLNELIETTKLEILPKYDIIKEDDLTTSRKVIIESLPIKKFIEKIGKELWFMEISDNGIRYSLPCNSIALRRSLIALAIDKNTNDKTEIDFSKILGKSAFIKREQFTAKGFTQAPLKFY